MERNAETQTHMRSGNGGGFLAFAVSALSLYPDDASNDFSFDHSLTHKMRNDTSYEGRGFQTSGQTKIPLYSRVRKKVIG